MSDRHELAVKEMNYYPKRKSNRLKEYDYSREGIYFVTINTKNHVCVFGDVVDDKMRLHEFGKYVGDLITEIEKKYPPVGLDACVIVPNHVHMIIEIKNKRTTRELSVRAGRRSMLLSKIIGYIKMNAAKRIHQAGDEVFRWHRSFFDRIIRNEKELLKMREYIRGNPSKWNENKENIGEDAAF